VVIKDEESMRFPSDVAEDTVDFNLTGMEESELNEDEPQE
jgi:hypothetical protein